FLLLSIIVFVFVESNSKLNILLCQYFFYLKMTKLRLLSYINTTAGKTLLIVFILVENILAKKLIFKAIQVDFPLFFTYHLR
ncbi:hypothetical protein, partial [Clostridium saccharobutylicum]|uniref:hypothetical protein n=1 Tax=Clostridium saccharobutylicum TaxID=169679 RepID=UPI001A9A2EB8